MKNKVALIIPYFGKIPEYFDLWAESAGKNDEFDFLIFSDLNFPVSRYKNIHLNYITFSNLCDIIKKKIGDAGIKLYKPYKLCDFKPAYGLIFSEYLTGYDYWGFCDIDLIFGQINHFINDDILNKYNKILTQGHFCLMKNNEKMNFLFREKYPNVKDYKSCFHTRFSCHFDENGTIAYADEYDSDIKLFFDWIYFDVDFNQYVIKAYDSECLFLWNNGVLTAHFNGHSSEEYMYVHLQKRKMHRGFEGLKETFIIQRDEFVDADESKLQQLLRSPIDSKKAADFETLKKIRNRNIKLDKLKTGYIKVFFISLWKKRRYDKRYIVTKERIER